MEDSTSRKTILNRRIKLRPRKPVIAPVPIASVTSVTAPHATVLLFYDSPAAVDAARLEDALQQVLESFPHLTGRLRLATPADQGPEYALRFRRPWIEYGGSDPGFGLEVERRTCSVAECMPTPVGERVFDAVPANDATLAPSIARSLVPEHEAEDLPVAGLKLTLFPDGAALCVSASHVLCDAGALDVFVRHLVAAYRGEPLPPPPALDYMLLDAQAEDPDAPHEDILEIEKELDVFRYDSWAAHPSAPPGFPPALSPEIDALDAAMGRPRGAAPPWETATDAPALAYVIEFSGDDIERIYTATVGDSTISRQDAFAAHLWRLIARSRGQAGDELLDCAMACDSRGRLPTPLDPETPGCWNICLGFQCSAKDILGAGGALHAASRVRQAVNTVNPRTTSAWLHKRAHDLDPTREWIVFPGTTTVCTTNWARCAFTLADFGAGAPVFAHNPVTGFGGYACILRKCGAGAKWYQPGVSVALWLEEEAMGRLLADPELRVGSNESAN